MPPSGTPHRYATELVSEQRAPLSGLSILLCEVVLLPRSTYLPISSLPQLKHTEPSVCTVLPQPCSFTGQTGLTWPWCAGTCLSPEKAGAS